MFFLAIRLEHASCVKRVSIEDSIIFFDGFCVLCSATVSLLIKLDKNRVLKYSSLQGKYAQQLLDLRHINSGASVIFCIGGVQYERAEAVIHILIKMGGLYKLLGFFLNVIPFFLLNKAYDLVALHRYRLFGKNDFCLIPKDEDKSRFIP